MQSGLTSNVSSSIVRPISKQHLSNQKSPEERIKELEKKLAAVTEENEAYKRLLKENSLRNSQNEIIHGENLWSQPLQNIPNRTPGGAKIICDGMMGIPLEKGKIMIMYLRLWIYAIKVTRLLGWT